MTSNRIVIGDIGSSAFGMKCSLPGVDATTADRENVALFAFSSSWANLARLGGSGYVNIPGQVYDPTTTAPATVSVYHGFGISPFHEVRSMEGTPNCIYGEFAVSKFVDLGASGGYTLVHQRIITTADGSSINIRLNAWYYKLFGAWQAPSPPTVRARWTAYVDPRP